MTSEVFNTDCLEYMRTLPDKAFQLAIADPSYGINAQNMKMGENKGYVSTATKCKKGRLNSGGGKLKNRVLNQSDCSWDCEPPKQEFLDKHSHCCDELEEDTCGGVSPFDSFNFEPFELTYENRDDWQQKPSL